MVLKFEFIVSGLTEDQADRLLEKVVEMVEDLGGSLSGGFLPQSAAEDDEPGQSDGQEEPV